MTKVIYNAGESIHEPGKTVDFMLACVSGTVEDFKAGRDGVFLYAEAENPVWDNEMVGFMNGTEYDTYDGLRAEIIRQAEEKGIDLAILEFDLD